jgi:uncharacterized protein Yka (UPF0111/DUF47 family)
VTLWSRDAELFGMVAELAGRLTAASRLLRDLFADPVSRTDPAGAIDDLKREANALRHELVVRIDKTFITTLDREEIHRSGVEFGAVIDWIAGTARRAVTFRVTDLRELAVRLTETLSQSAEQLEAGVSLQRQRKQALQHCVAVKRLEEQGDAMYFDALAGLFEGRPEVVEVLKWKELYDRLEEALERNERVAHLLESATVKL